MNCARGEQSNASAERSDGRALAALVLLALVAGCHGAGSSPGAATAAPPRAALSAVHTFGDTVGYGVRILEFDRVRETTRLSLARSSHLIVLAVVPGRDIELIHPAQTPMRAPVQSYRAGIVSLGVERYDDSGRPADADADAQSRLAYDRCMAQAAAAARRTEQARRNVRRDSTGKVIDDGTGGAQPVDQSRMEASCDRLARTTSAKTPPKRMPLRAPADRYLVVLASPWPLSVAQLNERLATLTTIAPDVATTIEAIAAGIYAGMPGMWSGTYVAW